jgi:hypothetical protein
VVAFLRTILNIVFHSVEDRGIYAVRFFAKEPDRRTQHPMAVAFGAPVFVQCYLLSLKPVRFGAQLRSPRGKLG